MFHALAIIAIVAATTTPSKSGHREAPTHEAGAESHPWAKYKVGTWVKWRSVTAMTTGGKTTEYVSGAQQTLISLDATKAVVEFVQTMPGGAEQKTQIDMPLRPDPAAEKAAAELPKPAKTGTETLTIGGKAFACRWSETVTVSDDRSRTTMRMWESDEMPGQFVKSVSTSEIGAGLTSVMTTEVSAFELK